MTRQLTKDTTLCMSLAARPSNFGTRFHNYLYEALGLDYIYKAFTTTDLSAAIGGVRALGVRGCAISMPFKEAVIPMVDELDTSVKAIDSVNTIVNTNGYLKAYNTDYIAIRDLLKQHQVNPEFRFVLRGSGGMAKAVAAALKNSGFEHGTIIARNEATGRKLADLYGYEWQPDLTSLEAELIINVTPIGMSGSATATEIAFPQFMIENAKVVFDVVAMPVETPLILAAKLAKKQVITGAEVFAIQAVEQFALYTGHRPDDETFRKAAEHARAV